MAIITHACVHYMVQGSKRFGGIFLLFWFYSVTQKTWVDAGPTEIGQVAL